MSISIKKLNDDVFEVTVADSITTVHEVKVTDQNLTDLTDNTVTKTQLLEFSLKFLLDKEPNTSILSSFDVNVILKYFSDYRDEVNVARDCGNAHAGDEYPCSKTLCFCFSF
jgi:hypothetical protein